MWVKLKDGEHRCVDNEFDVADIVERYCGSELAELIRECQYTNIVANCNDALEELGNADDVGYDGDMALYHIERAMLLLEEYI